MLVVPARALRQVRGTILVDVVGSAGGDADHASLYPTCAEEHCTGRAEFPEQPPGVNVIEHGDHKRALQIASSRQ